ncbi:MAG: hypothetical protein F6K28_55030, partial [Microcoleus sp. SIO2G3]|nr:hypothetical protein [Microcoleus sp. SIO2G3]
DLERFRRLIIIGSRLNKNQLDGNAVYDSPPLASFLEALELFMDGFGAGDTGSSGGYRLLRIARPPVLFYGLYGSASVDDAEQRLIQLIIHRNILADQLDNIAQFGLPAQIARAQVLLDKILYNVDRGIDLYAVGTEDFGDPERRAAANNYLIRAFFNRFFGDPVTDGSTPPRFGGSITGLRDDLSKKAITTSFVGRLNNEFSDLLLSIQRTLRAIQREFLPSGLRRLEQLEPGATESSILKLTDDSGQRTLDDARLNALKGAVSQELHIQKDMESRWRNLVRTMAPSTILYSSEGNTDIFDELTLMVSTAIALVQEEGIIRETDEERNKRIERSRANPFTDGISLPPDDETSLMVIAENLKPDSSRNGE